MYAGSYTAMVVSRMSSPLLIRPSFLSSSFSLSLSLFELILIADRYAKDKMQATTTNNNNKGNEAVVTDSSLNSF